MSKHHSQKELRKSDFESIEQSIEKDWEFSGEDLTDRTVEESEGFEILSVSQYILQNYVKDLIWPWKCFLWVLVNMQKILNKIPG